jgi:hypothetical protein
MCAFEYAESAAVVAPLTVIVTSVPASGTLSELEESEGVDLMVTT